MTSTRTLLLGGLSVLLLGSALPAAAQDTFYLEESFEAQPAEDPNYRYPDESTPLMWAVYEGDTARVERLIDAGADVNASNRYGANAMQLAAEVANVEMLKMLLDAGADVDSPNPEGQTALMLVARTGNVDAAKLLVKHGATINAREGWGEQTALMWATARRHPEMVDYLIRQGADVDARSTWRDYQRHITSEARAKNMDSGGLTPLLYAARENCVECADVLIKHGADVDLPDPDRVSPLLLAIMNSNWDIAVSLIEAGADVNQWDKFGQSPLFALASRRTDRSVTSIDALHEATGTDVMQMLLERGANPNMQLFMRPAEARGAASSRGGAPLHAAAAANDVGAVKMLLEAGADVNLRKADNETALMLAMDGGSTSFFAFNIFGPGPAPDAEDKGLPVIDALLEAGIDLNANALQHHVKRTRGGTALHYAVRAGWGRAIDRLAEAGIDLDIKDPDGLTALDYAMARGYVPFLTMRQPPRLDLAEKLRAHGATVELPDVPDWPEVSPPVYYAATVWPLSPDVPEKSYEDMEPSEFIVDAVANLEYP